MIRRARLVVPVLALGLNACSGGDQAVAQRNEVFYEYQTFGADARNQFERAYPPLDKKATEATPDYIGVSVLQSKVRISRPSSWIIRAASNEPGKRYIQYVSPNEYVVSLIERNELSNAPWHDVLARYENDLKEGHAELVDPAVPMATWNGQGRAYLVRRKVYGAKAAFVSVSREYLIRGDRDVILVQIVHPSAGLRPVSAELSRVIETLQVR